MSNKLSKVEMKEFLAYKNKKTKVAKATTAPGGKPDCLKMLCKASRKQLCAWLHIGCLHNPDGCACGARASAVGARKPFFVNEWSAADKKSVSNWLGCNVSRG